ncbi:retrovirus-related pol polyprotein from transposon TNT 1-94 [Tanacetum coccineum]|uniref:Retrovirus-related pol polyprotein from transposon TNT 1-94 n=1 Tax=Tanacetum coccineum TaxID=301880 RepID=A0ABQ5GK79_9ASTR
MLASSNYVQWKSIIKRYIDTKPNHELIHFCLKNPPYQYKFLTIDANATRVTLGNEGTSRQQHPRGEVMKTFATVLEDIQKWINVEAESIQIILIRSDNDIYFTVDACPNAMEMWKSIKRLKQGEAINVQDLETNLSQVATRNRVKAIANSPPPTYDPEPKVVAEDDASSNEKDIEKLMALISMCFKKIYKPNNNNLNTSSNTRNLNVDNIPRSSRGSGYDRQTEQYDNQRVVNVVGARENVGTLVAQQAGIWCFNCKEFGNVARECKKAKRVWDLAYHKENMLLCKQEKAAIQLSAEQVNWRDYTDDEPEDQELEAHYMYMEKIQEVTLDAATNSRPIFDVEPLQKLVEIILFIVYSGCSKDMTGNLKLLRNFVEKFLDLEVAFRKSTCYVRDLKGNDVIIGSRGTNIYSITLQDTTSPNPICLMAKASSSQAWLWHHRLSHPNFDTINLLSKNDSVIGLPKLKLVKDNLCSSCENTWTHFVRSKDETPEVLIEFPRFVQRGLHAHVRIVRTNKDILFSPMFDEYFNGATIVVSKSLAIPTIDTSDQRQQPNTNPSTSTTVVADQTQLEIHSTPKPTTLEPTVIATENIDQAEDVMVDEGHPSKHHWTRDHPLEQELVDRLLCKNIINMKWLWKNKRDEENTVILNKARLVAKDIVKQKELILKSHLYQLLDSDHACCLDTRKSTSGGIPFLGGDKLVSWSSKKKDCTSMSTAEAEYMSLSMCCVQVFWMRTQLTDYGFHFDKIPMYCDSKAAIAISCNPVQHSCTKHINVRYHFIKEHVEMGIVELLFIITEYQLADLFTKALSEDRSYALSWKPCQGGSFKLNLPDHRYKRWCFSLISVESDSLPHAHAQVFKYNQRSSKSIKIGDIVSLMKKRRLGAFKISMSMPIKRTSLSRKSNQDDSKQGDDARSQAIKFKRRRLMIKITKHEGTKPLQIRKDKDKTKEGKA